MPIYVQLSSKEWNVKNTGLCEVHAMRLGWQNLSPATWIPVLRGISDKNYSHSLEVGAFNFGVTTPYDSGNGSVVGKRPHGSPVPGGQSGEQSSGSSMNPSKGVELQGFAFGVQSPVDIGGNSGKPGGKRPHNPIIIRWLPSGGIPVYVYQGKPFQTLNLNFFTSPDAGNYPSLKVILSGATISGVQSVPNPDKHPSQTDTHELEEVNFTFQQIDMNGLLNSTSSSDDWTTGTGSGKKKGK